MSAKTNEKFLQEMRELHPNIEVLDTYVAAKIPVVCRCTVCGHSWKARPLNLTFRKNPTGCPKCSGSMKKTNDEFREEVAKLHPNIEILGPYVNSHTPIRVRCAEHNYEFEAIPTNILRRYTCGCRYCNTSSDSALARDLKAAVLRKYTSAVAEYKVLKSPVTGRWLPYDIFIPNLKGEDVFIEVMGVQHYKRNAWLTEKTAFQQQARDHYKERYAVTHGRYVEIDLRAVSTVEEAMLLVENEHPKGWIAAHAQKLPAEFIKEDALMELAYLDEAVKK